MNQDLSDDQIRFYLGNECKIYKYSELRQFENIIQLLPKRIDFCIILVESSPNKGHWTALLKYGKVIENFDSYGCSIDNELKFISKGVRKALGEEHLLLTNLLKTQADRVIFNKVKFQKLSNQVATCGRHCIFRILKLLHDKMSLSQYIKYMEREKKIQKKSFDQLVLEFVP